MSLDTSKVASTNGSTAATASKPSKVGGLATWLASTSVIGLVLVAVLALAAGLTFYTLAKRKPISAADIHEGDTEREPVAAAKN